MGVGHIVDANTVALWRFDETTHQDYSSFAEANGTYTATQSTNASRPGISQGPQGNGNAVWFVGGQGLDFSPDSAMITAFQGDWTWEAWIYVYEFTGTDTWFDVGAVGETPATDVQARIQITASGFLQIFWEHSGGSNVQITQSTGTTISEKTWTYVAITASVSGSTRTVNFFIDSGTSQDSGSNTNNTDGSSSIGTIGVEFDGGLNIFGAISQMRFSDKVRTSTELNDNATATDYAFSNDANTIALWKFDDTPEIADISGNNQHLTPINKGSDQPLIVESLLRTDGGRAREFSSASNQTYVAWYSEQMRTMLLGEWTIEFWGVLTGGNTDHGICEWGQGGTVEANNYLISLGLEVSVNDYLADVFWEEGGGNNIGPTAGTGTIVSNDTEGATNRTQVHHYAFVFEDVTATTRNVLCYRDGTLVDTIGPLTKPTGGTDPSVTDYGLRIGDGLFQGPFQGFIDDMRLSDKARSATEILESYTRGAETLKRAIPGLPRTT